MSNSDNNQPAVAAMDLELVNYFLKKFALNCEKGISMEMMEKDINQLYMVIDSFVIYGLIRSGNITELNEHNHSELAETIFGV